jgi:hypothetical protein
MHVTYGADYSERELSPSELDRFNQYDIRFLIRYIGGLHPGRESGRPRQVALAGRPGAQ